MTETPAPEFSYLLPVDSIGNVAKRIRIEVDSQARSALARRFGFIAIESLSAALTVSRIADSRLLLVSGVLRADIVQACVVSQEPVAARICEEISERFGPDVPASKEAVFDHDGEDPPERFTGDAIEIGELLAQCLAVSVDPYPRSPDAEIALPAEGGQENGTSRKNSPFSALSALKKNLG